LHHHLIKILLFKQHPLQKHHQPNKNIIKTEKHPVQICKPIKTLYICIELPKFTTMATIRFKALEEASNRQPIKTNIPDSRISEHYGINVFDRIKMQKYLPKEAYESVVSAIDEGLKIDRRIASQVATGMKTWAIEHGATHYTHWFLPLNGSTAEKHDGFFDLSKDRDRAFEEFSGELLIQQEPDASSFPNGGIRNTFEARGYTAWDPSSPAFILDKTLCIPTIFVSYTGEALDYKTPLLKSLNILDRAAVEVCNYFDKNITKVTSTVGWEQEYFLIDKALYNARPDLKLTSRTIMGHASAKDQQLDDHYFGAIPERVLGFMQDLEFEAIKLGIPLKTRHNEVAPSQFECAPIFEEANLAVDHNQLLQSLMKKIAKKHNLEVLLHEKPYKGINGSGKHNNWSLQTNTNVNLLSPGKTPKNNLQFLTFLINTIKAVKDYDTLLRASILTESNQHRLGAHEAPPAIISVFIGQKLTQVLDDIEQKVSDKKMTPDEKTELKLDIIGKIPEILLDNTDRNRTSPFAFTGNRFEFRAVGSSANCSSALISLNTAVARQLQVFKKDVDNLLLHNDELKKDEAIFRILRKYIIDSKDIRFEGNGYGEEWIAEAESRGLTNIKDVPTAVKAFVEDKTIDLFEKTKVLSKRELESRLEIRLETYIKKIQIETRVIGDLAINHIIPTALRYQNTLIENIKGIKSIGIRELDDIAEPQVKSIKKIGLHVKSIREQVVELVRLRKEANRLDDISKKADTYSSKIKPYLEDIRYHIDKLELIVDDEIWPLPKYREMLFSL
jgi:glutamine synthetase